MIIEYYICIKDTECMHMFDYDIMIYLYYSVHAIDATKL